MRVSFTVAASPGRGLVSNHMAVIDALRRGANRVAAVRAAA
jgi:hypothetical protein